MGTLKTGRHAWRTVAQPALTAVVIAAGLLAACSTPGSGTTKELTLRTLNDSGVTGTVTLTAVAALRTSVQIEVDAAGHPNMPAHIHPGTCDELVPQPKYPLESVADGRSTTEIPVSLDELLLDTVALNLHRSNDDMATYTACVELR